MYWSERQKQLYAGLEKDEAALKRRLITYYSEESASLDKDIAAYYQKYGENGVIKYRTLKESLSNEERQLLMRNCDEYAKKYPQYADLLPIRKSIYKLDRLEGLQYSIMLHQYNIGAITQAELDEHLRRQALKGVNAAQEALGFGKNFYAENADVINLFVGVPWANGKDFSQTIWDNADKLINYLKYDFASGIARGDSYQKLTAALQNRFLTVNKNDAYRLVYTEGTYVMAESTMQPFKEDFEQYKASTAADGKVCSKCADISHQVFYIKDRTPGVNFPPLHPWCRCTFEIYVEDWDKWQDDYVKRHSKNPDKILKSLKSNDIINADVDELVPCLKNAKTGEIVETYVREMSRNELAEYTLKNGWSDNWKDRPQNENVYGLYIENSKKLQGLIALRPEKGCIYIASAAASPNNNPLVNNGQKDYLGVGGHLFAIAAEECLKIDDYGAIYGYAVNDKVLKHYIKEFNAVHIPTRTHEYQFFIDTEDAINLLRKYNYERK